MWFWPQLWPYSPTHLDVLPRPIPPDSQLARMAAGFLVAPLDKFGWYWEWFRFWKHVWRFFTNLLWLGAWQDWEKEKQIQLKEERILKLFCKIIFHVAYFNYISCWIYLMLNIFNYISIFRISGVCSFLRIIPLLHFQILSDLDEIIWHTDPFPRTSLLNV